MFFTQEVLASDKCIDIFSQNKISVENINLAEMISHEAALYAETDLTEAGVPASSRRGYAVLIGAMVGSAALTTHLGSHINHDFQFLSVFVSQVSTLGVFVLGAPIWEPISSRFRKWAFGIRKTSSLNGLNDQQQLEAVWLRTQENYSLNAQMSRNVINQFILSVRQNFSDAHHAYQNPSKAYSADQIAEAAYRLRVLFKDIPPDDASVAAAVHASFTNHIEISTLFINLVIEKIKKLDNQFYDHLVQEHYRRVLQSWLLS